MIGWSHALQRRASAIRWPSVALGASVGVLVLLASMVAAPYAFDDGVLRNEIGRQVRAATGLALTTKGKVRFALLPQPHVVADELHVSGPGESLTIDAGRLQGDVRLLPLLVGRIELTGATLIRPRLVIDLDGPPIQPDSTLGQAMSAKPAPSPTSQRLGTVTLVDGTAVIKSRQLPEIPAFDAVNVTIDWPDLESSASVTGSAAIEKTPADFAAWLAQPSNLLRGGHSDVTLSVHSAPLELKANGDLATAEASTFRGYISTSTPSLPELFRLVGAKFALPAPFANVSVSSDAIISVTRDGKRSVDLPNLHLRTDDNGYEGTLAFQSGDKPLFEGTLACDQLNLAPFLKRLPPLLDAQRHWSTFDLFKPGTQNVDLDLRISANHLRVSSFSIDDAALSVMTRDDRTEVGLIEGKAYSGTVRGRLSFGRTDAGMSVRGAGSLSDVDAATLSWDAVGRQLATGTLAGSANLEAVGDTPATLVASLSGSAKVELRDGEFSTVDVGSALRDHTAPKSTALKKGRTPFRVTTAAVRVFEGFATIENGLMSGPEANGTLHGGLDIQHRVADVEASVAEPELPGRPIPLSITGSFDQMTVAR